MTDDLTRVGGPSCHPVVSPVKWRVASGGGSWRNTNPGWVAKSESVRRNLARLLGSVFADLDSLRLGAPAGR